MSTNLIRTLDVDQLGNDMYELMVKLYPINRSITGNGVRKTLNILKEYIPLKVIDVPSGKKVFDWTIPKEWNIEDAYIKNSSGEKVVDYKKSNLHVLNYSIPVNKKITLKELNKNLFTLPDHPDWIPYRTSYYAENWGFCLAHNQYLKLPDDEYEVVIESTLEDGFLTYGECFIKGEKSDEILFSCHICHPSLCNDNLSGIALATFLAKNLSNIPLRYSYRFLFIPGTIGSITWLSMNKHNCFRIKHGLVVSCVGDSGKFIYKKSRQGNADIDKAVKFILKNSHKDYEVIDFFPYGYDERQYCSPAFNLPIGCLSRSTHNQYPEYHTSADNFDIIGANYLAESFEIYLSVINLLEKNKKCINKHPHCEPQLGKRGLYDKIGAGNNNKERQLAMLWILNYSDGNNSLLDISEKSGLDFGLIQNMAELLLLHGLIK
jgi:aminopeptidase-like protein